MGVDIRKYLRNVLRMSTPRGKPDPDASSELGAAFLGLQAYQLLDIIDSQGTELLTKQGIHLPSRVASTMMHLKKRKRVTVTGLAGFLGMSHQLVNHRLKDLKAHGLIKEVRDPGDRRLTIIVLTKSGKALARQIERLCKDIENVYLELFEEIGVDLFDALIKAKLALTERSLSARLSGRRRKTATSLGNVRKWAER